MQRMALLGIVAAFALAGSTLVGAASSGLEVDMLIAAGCVKRVISTYVGGEVLAPTPSDHRPIRARLRLTGGVT